MAIFKKKKQGKDISEKGGEAEEGFPPLEDKYKPEKIKGKKAEEKTKKPAAAKPMSTEIKIEFEKLKTETEALSQMRGIFNERFSTISEQIGELRNMIVNQEQEFSELEVKSAKTNDIMSQLEPDRILKDISKIDMQIEAIKGKMDSNEAVNSMIMDEIKKQRSKMALFKGIEDTIKLNEEVREELTTIKKVESNIEMHSNKVASMFLQVQKRFNEFEKYKEMAENLNSAVKEQMQEFDTIKVRFADLIKPEDLKSAKEEITGVMDNFGKRLLSIEKIAGSINDLVTAKNFIGFREQNMKILKEHQNALKGIGEIRERLDKITEEKETVKIPEMDKLKEIFAAAADITALEEELTKLKTIMGYGFKRVQQMESKMFVEKETYEMIRQLIRKYLDKGYTKRQIVDAFEMQGWPKSLIKQYIET